MKDLFFPDDYFQDEEREGFLVEKMMKHAWAAQLVVLKDIDEVCKKHDIKWFADYGTLLGAIRHKGFIPWDDDIDISMIRPDYDKFIRIADRELTKGHRLLNFHHDDEYADYMSRVVNHDHIDVSKESMEKYYNCPFALGIDITPLDYIPRDKANLKIYRDKMLATVYAANICEGDEYSEDEKKAMISRIEKKLKVKIRRGMPVAPQLRQIAEKIMGMYGPKDADVVGPGLYQIDESKQYYVDSASCFDEIIEVPFETTTMPVPKGYDQILKTRFGENYMIPVRYENHDYPFYKEQQEIIDRELSKQI